MDSGTRAGTAEAAQAGRPTLKTIAGETGLAIATVSRALKNAPDIGEETKKRVREAKAVRQKAAAAKPKPAAKK